nr:uncharacterized protein LOC126055217 [Helicoverpa armigera]XP_049699406.1 uncharacterized protein LOC126055217 [Helicoverpa armigera]
MEQTHIRGSLHQNPVQTDLLKTSTAMQEESANIQKQMLYNGLLFNVIRKNKTLEKKIKKITEYLEAGANINAADANDKCNTPLHIAVINADWKVVNFLLDRGANISLKNSDNHTALDVALLLKSSQGGKIVYHLTNIAKDKESDLRKRSSVVDSKPSEEVTAIQEPEQLFKDTEHNKINKRYQYRKRKGTSGLGGHLYESKLLCLILLRALNDDYITEFYLATNVSGLGAFDDIVFKYKTKYVERPRIIFLQAKHRDDPKKDQVSINDIFKDNGDFSLHKYLESYIEVVQKFQSDSENEIFGSSFVDTDCEFIIFTSAMENLCDRGTALITDKESYVTTSDSGKILQFHAKEAEVKCLIQTVVKLRAVQLAKRLAAFIFKKSCQNMMIDEIIKVYHVFLAQNVISVTKDNEPNSSYNIGIFKDSFLQANDNVLLLMKHTICKELGIFRDTTLTDETAALKSINFELPKNFGNVTFQINGNENKKLKRLNYLSGKIREILQNASKRDSYFVFEITENDIGAGKILQTTDLESYRLGGLVGNLLLYDQETKMLKFNDDEHQLTDDSLKLLQELNTNYSLSQYRLHVKIKSFPKLSLIEEEDDRKLVKDFLDKLKFYTNQPKEDEVENIIKDEIYDTLKLNRDDSFSRVKCDAILLKIHDKVQKWWKQSNWSPYLTKTCKFYIEAKCDALYKPLLAILNYTCCRTIQSLGATFKPYAIKALNVTDFIKNDSKLMIIVSPEINLTSIKMIQYFQENDFSFNFLKLESTMNKSYIETIERELKDAYFSVLVLIDAIGKNLFDVTFDVVRRAFQGKIIVITDADYAIENLGTGSNDIIRILDNNNNYGDLEDDVQRMITEERELIFQGERVSVGSILTYDFLQTIKPKTVYQFFKGKTISMGKSPKDAVYDKSVDFYVPQEVSRNITLDLRNIQNYCDLVFIIDGVPEDLSPQESYDIVLITDRIEIFEHICNKYEHSNVHMFSRDSTDDNYIVWVKSKGSLNALLQYYNIRRPHFDFDASNCPNPNILPKTLTDIPESIVIISGEPGLGKSTLLSHLAVHTKEQYTKLWVSKINFHDHIEWFSTWKRDKTNVNLEEALVFVYGAIGLQALEENEQPTSNVLDTSGKRVSINSVNEITMRDVNKTDDVMEVALFNYCYNNNQVALLFDGFDEICPDYANEALQLLSVLKSSRVAYLWVTTRPYVLDQLQCTLSTFAHILLVLSENGRVSCLAKIWSKQLDLDPATLTEHVSNFYSLVCEVLDDWVALTFTGVPLHIFMIAETLLHRFINYAELDPKRSNVLPISSDDSKRDNIVMNLCTLYETFINIKFYKVRFGSKKAFVSFKDPDLRRMLDQEHKAFLDHHKQLSAYTLLKGSTIKFSDGEMQNIYNLVEAVRSGEEKSGIIDMIVGDKPKFVHRTFMEYFAAQYIIERLKSSLCSKDLLKHLINYIFGRDGGVSRFLDSMLSEKDLFDAAFYQNNSETVVDILLSQFDGLFTTFNFVCRREFNNILLFLLKCSRPALNKHNLRNFIDLFHHKFSSSKKIRCEFCIMETRKTEACLYFNCIVSDIDNSLLPKLCKLYNCTNKIK